MIRNSRHIIAKDTASYYLYIFCYDLKIEDAHRKLPRRKFGKREVQAENALSRHFIYLPQEDEFFQIPQTARNLGIKAIFLNTTMLLINLSRLFLVRIDTKLT